MVGDVEAFINPDDNVAQDDDDLDSEVEDVKARFREVGRVVANWTIATCEICSCTEAGA